MTEAHPLDNATWRSLTTGHATLAEVHGGARRYPVDVSPFAAVDRFDGDAWGDLAALVGARGRVVLFRDHVPPPPPGWSERLRGTGIQLVLRPEGLRSTGLPSVGDLDVVALTDDDVPRMLELTAATEPGPFLARTATLGSYVGSVREGRLLAMAGERLHPEGFTEISAVCTDAAVRGQGLAAGLTATVAAAILDRGERPFLHVASTNAGAQRVYERLGFEVRRTVDFVAFAPPSSHPVEPHRGDRR